MFKDYSKRRSSLRFVTQSAATKITSEMKHNLSALGTATGDSVLRGNKAEKIS